jgi:type IV pilus assembly protein PilA
LRFISTSNESSAALKERGFTLIELLVAILIIALLAAVAVPIFLRQREKGWVAQLQAAMRNAATAEELYMAVSGTYTEDEIELRSVGGWRTAPDVSLTSGNWAGAEGYCLEGTHALLPDDHTWKLAHFSSELRTFGQGSCPGWIPEGDDDDSDDDDSDDDDSDDDDSDDDGD